MNLTSCLHAFFDQYLPKTKGVSKNTILAYRQTLGLFVPFAARYLQREAKSLARMIRLLCPEQRALADRILSTPQKKRLVKKFVEFLTLEEVMKVLDAVDLKIERRFPGLRNYPSAV